MVQECAGYGRRYITPSLITTKSTTFRITSTGYLNDIRKRVIGTIERQSNDRTARILSWRVD